MTMLHDPERLARLKLSIGTRMRQRPMTPAEVAVAIEEFAAETGEPIEKVARRLGVRADTCRMFLAILDLPKDWWGLWHFGQADSSGRLPFSMAGKLGNRFKNGKLAKDDLDMLKGAALDSKRPMRRDDLTNILAYKAKNPEKTLERCITDVMNLTPERITSYVVITDIDPGFLAKIGKNDSSIKDAITAMLERNFSDGVVADLRIKDDIYLHILLDKKGHDEFYALAKRRNVPASCLINHLCSEEFTHG